MISLKKLVTLSFIFGIFIYPSVSWAMINSVDSIEEVEKKVKILRKKGVEAKKLCVVLDFHGVVTKETTHQPTLHLKENIKTLLTYLKQEKISYLIATAWDNFDDIITAIISLGLQDFFDVRPDPVKLQDFYLGVYKKDFVGYKNGKVAALRKAKYEEGYFFNKAFTLELIYPNNLFEYIFFIDDQEKNLEKFAKDSLSITPTANPKFKHLELYHLTNP